MMSWERYAIYYTATGKLADFGAKWLGWDIVSGQNVPHPAINGLTPERISAITQTPRRYGFHATLKPPFRLNPDMTEAALREDLVRLTASQAPVDLAGGLRLAALHGFPALIPAQPSDDLTALASHLVRDLDHHRAPLTAKDRARRNPDRLSARQCAYLDQWGYPWVMEEFQFHMTLGGHLPDSELDPLIEALSPIVTPLLSEPHPIDAVTLVGQDPGGNFHQIERFLLTGTASARV